jgi:hypothetical protein
MRWAKSFWKSKTTWTGIVALLGAMASYLAGKESLAQAEQQAVVALFGVFLRDSIAKTAEPPNLG